MHSPKNYVLCIFIFALVIQRLKAQHLATEQLAVTKLLKTDFKRSTVNSTTVSEKLPNLTSSGLYFNLFSNFTLQHNVPKTFPSKLLPPAVDNSKIIYAPADPLMEDLFDNTESENKSGVPDTQLYSLKLGIPSQAISDKRTETSYTLISQKIDFFPNDTVLVANQSCLVSAPDSLSNKGLIKFLVLTNDSARHNLPKLFEILLRRALNETNCNSVLMMSFHNCNPFSFSWTNASMNSTVCEHGTLDKISEKIFNGTNISAQFSKAFLPYFKIQSVDIKKLGICILKLKPNNNGYDLISISVLVVLGLATAPFFIMIMFTLLCEHKCNSSSKVKPKGVLKARPPFLMSPEDISLADHIKRVSKQRMHDAKLAKKHQSHLCL